MISVIVLFPDYVQDDIIVNSFNIYRGAALHCPNAVQL